MKKVLVIIQAFVFFAFMVMPKPAHAAAPIAIAAGAEAGAGAYALILLGVAGVASGLGYVEYSEEIKQHALDTWNATNDAIKEAWNASVQAAAAAGTYIVEVPANVVEYFRGKQAEMISVGVPYEPAIFEPTQVEVTGTDGYPVRVSTMYPTAKRTVAKNSASFSFTQGDLMFYDKSIGWAFRDLKFDRTTGIYGIQTLESYTFGRPEGSVSKYYAGPSALASFDTLVALQTVEQGMALAHAPSLTIINPGEAMRLKDELSKARSVPLIGSPALPLTETGTLRIPIPLDGIRDVGGTWDFPMPTIKDGEVVVSVPTGDIVVSKPDVLNPPTTTTPDDAWTNPQVPSQVNINWRPLVMVGEELTTKFPFSIPWDVKRQLSVFNVAPQSPVLKVDKSVPVFGSSVKFKFDIDFSLFDPLAFVARWFLTIAFDIGLILALRRFLPE